MTAAGAQAVRPEWRLLLGMARARLSDAEREQLAEELNAPLDWNELLAAAARHGVWPLLHRHVEASPALSVPAEVRAALQKVMRDHTTYAAARAGEVHALLEAFRGAGLDLIPYKGPVLAERLYGACALRQFSDLDFLVRREEARRAGACLQAQGYQAALGAPSGWESWYENARHEYSFHHPRRGVYVELHWGAWPRFVPMPVDVASFWERRETVVLAGRPVPSLGLEDLLFFLCLHGTKHQWCRLSWLVDVAEILRAAPALDWTRVWALADASGSERFLGIGLRLAKRLLDAPVPAAVLERLAADRRLAQLAELMERGLRDGSVSAPGEEAQVGFILRALPRLRDRLRMGWGLATEPCHDDWTRWPLPPRLVGLYALLRPCRLATLAVKRRLAR